MVKKKLISLLCILTLVVGMLPMGSIASAKATYEIDQKAELIHALGIIDSAEAQNITLRSYLKMMSRIYQDGEIDPIDFGVMMKMIEGNEVPSENISVADAVKYAVITMGYRVVAESEGGDVAAYTKIAQDTEIADGISPMSEKNITFEEAVTIIFNMLEATPMIQKFITGGDAIYEVLDGETMLSHKLRVEKINGVVTGTPLTSIYKAEGCGEGKIEIDTKLYLAADDFSEFLGKKVEAYVSEDKNGDATVLYVIGDKNNEVVIDAEFISRVDTDANIAEYYNAEKTSKKKIKLEYPPKVIYNDRFYSDYVDADLIPAIGSVRFVDNDNNNKYDIIFVDSYKEMIVESRISKDKTLVNKLSYTDALASITLEGTVDKEYKVIRDGKEVDFGEIAIGSTVLVKESKDNIAVTVIVSTEILEGTLTALDEPEREIIVGKKVYKITDSFISALKAKIPEGVEQDYYEIGTDYKFFLDAFGNVVYMEKIQEMNYYLYFKSYMDDVDGNDAVILYMNMNNEWNTAQTAKKVEFAGEKCDGEVLLEHLQGKKPQLVKMEFNGRGEVKKLELATDTDLYKENVFTRTTSIAGWYYSAQRTIDYRFYANYGAQVLKMPAGDEIMDKTLYKFEPVESNFGNDKYVTCRAFDIDEFNFSSMFTMELSAAGLASALSDDYFLVTKKKNIVYNDEPAVELVGMVGRFSNFSYIVKDISLAEDIQKGDLIRYHVNEKGYIDYLTKEFSMEGPFTSRWTLPNGNAKLISGTLVLIDLDKGIMKLDNGKTLMIVGTNTVMFYEKGSGDVRIGGLSDLTIGSKLVINGSWHKIAAMYCVE